MREKSTSICDIDVRLEIELYVKYDLNIKNYEYRFILESSKTIKFVKVVKSQNFDF